jgi:hypothetical protein
MAQIAHAIDRTGKNEQVENRQTGRVATFEE